MPGTPKGIRTPDSAVKGRRLRPLVDGSIYKTHKSKATFNPKLNAYCIHHNNEQIADSVFVHNLVPYRRIVAGAPAMRRFLTGDPEEIRTPVAGVRGWLP